MIRILNIISDTNIGGAGHATVSYLKAMDTKNFEAGVVLPKNSLLAPKVRALKIPAIEIDAMADKSFDTKAVKILEGIIKDYDPDIVHTHGSLSGRIAGRKLGKKVVFTRHSAFNFPTYVQRTPIKLLYRYLYQHYSDEIIAISPAGAKILTDIGISPSIVNSMMNGCEALERLPQDECECLQASLSISPDDFVLGIVARIEDYKGHLDILAALKIVKAAGRKVKLIIAGTGSYEEAVRQGAKNLGIENEVIFTGFIEDVTGIMSIMDVQLNASYVSETSSLSLLEGMSISLPAIVSDCSGNPYVIDDGVSGLLFPPRDAGVLAECILRLMDDRSLLERLGIGAKRSYDSRFTLEVFARNIENIYRKTLDSRKKEVKSHE